MPKVSVIVPIYNVEKYIGKCLDSLVSQTLRDIEVILVNDGSTDNSEKIIEEYKRKYYNFNMIYLKKENGGLSDARNYGMKRATGDYIAFLDSDDFADPTLYEKMYNKAVEEGADYVECDFYWAYPKRKGYRLKSDIGVRYRNKKEMFINARVVAWNKLIKREFIEYEFPKGLKYEDMEFFYKHLPNIKKFAFVEEPLVYYVQRKESLANKQDYSTGQIFSILNNVIDFYRKHNLYEEYKNCIEYTYTRILLCSSLKRMAKVTDKVAREKLFYETWQNLNTKFPEWKNNQVLQEGKGFKNFYMKHMNKFIYDITCKILAIF